MLSTSKHFSILWGNWGSQKLHAFPNDTKTVETRKINLILTILFQALNVFISLPYLFNLHSMICCHRISTCLLSSPLAELTLRNTSLELIQLAVLGAPVFVQYCWITWNNTEDRGHYGGAVPRPRWVLSVAYVVLPYSLVHSCYLSEWDHFLRVLYSPFTCHFPPMTASPILLQSCLLRLWKNGRNLDISVLWSQYYLKQLCFPQTYN